jgi:cholesterol oxidase
VVAAGVLRLGVADFTKVLAGIRVIDAEGPAESARILARFGRFFAGELWESYLATAH